MREVRSDEARRSFRELLDEVQGDTAAAIQVLRYDRPVAVIVSADWYARTLGFLGRAGSLGDVRHLDGDATNNDPRNLEIRDAPKGES
jgi:antitoxin (DNA-binding transcriptional repressor) of toxin-antitoxin stability system